MFALFSCKSTSNDNVVDNTKNNSISFVRGVDTFSATGGVYVGVLVVDTGSFHNVEMTGTEMSNGTTQQIVIILDGSTLVAGKKYNVTALTGANQIEYVKNGVVLPATSGIVTVNTVTGSTAKGTFVCTFSDNTTITNGAFNIIY